MNTVLLLLLAADIEGVGIFKGFGGVRKQGSDDAGIQVDLTLYWPIRTSAEAKELDAVIPGASAGYADRDKRDDDDPAKSDHVSTRKFQDDSRHVTLNLVQDGGKGGGRVILSDQSCSVISASFKTSKKAASYEVKVRVYGLTAKQVGEIAEGLTQHVGVHLVADQASLFDGKAGKVVRIDEHRKAVAAKVGQLVTGKLSAGGEFSGIVKEVTPQEGGPSLLTVEDIGPVTMEVRADQIVSALNVVPPKGKTMEWVVSAYQEKATKKGTRQTWAAIVQALGEVHAQELTPSESWTISAAVVEAASKINVKAPEAEEDEEEPEPANGEIKGEAVAH